MAKKYKAIITDVDGTLIPNRFDGTISPKVAKAVKMIKDKIHFGLATSRDLDGVKHIISHLSLSGPSIIYGGSWIVDTSTEKTLWQQNINRDDFDKAYDVAKKLGIFFVVNDNGQKYKVTEPYAPQKPINIWGHGLDTEQLEAFLTATKDLSSLAIHPIPSWKDGKVDFIVNHAGATKQHAILEVAKILGITTDEIIGIGDGQNDMPLLMACGLKVAVGNADNELKAIADYIAPSVEEDGIADVIEKFVL